jgi:type II secretory pathway component PulK
MRARRGVALIVVLWTVLLLATITAVASSAARGSADVADARRAGATARAMAESGIVAAVARIDGALALAGSDSSARARVLDGLEQAPASPGSARAAQPLVSDTLDDGVFAVAVVDVSARLDVNLAGRDGWMALLRQFATQGEARDVADRIASRLDRRSGDDVAQQTRDSLVAALLGRDRDDGTVQRSRGAGRFESLDDLLLVPAIDAALLMRIAPLLTVDGTGTINRRAAPPAVLAAASGQLVDHPDRLLLVSRGWRRGHPLTREIEAVYDVASDGLRLVRWRERDR